MVVAAVRGRCRCQPVVVVVERWPLSLSNGGGDCCEAVVVVAEWWWLVVVERWWPLVVGGMLEVVVAVRAVVVVGRWQRVADVAVVRVVTRCWAV